MNAVTTVFHLPELLELILLSLPADSIHQEIASIRTILASQPACRTWHALLQHSTPLRQRLYLPTPLDATESRAWHVQSAFPPARPNPWIPQLLLHQRSWGSAWPFADLGMAFASDLSQPSRPRYWTFSVEFSRAQFNRLPSSDAADGTGGESWRQQLAASPPFTDFWATRAFYELGSGRAPFVTHLDYDARKPKHAQRYRWHAPNGVTLGMLVDAVREMFAKSSSAKLFVMVESVRCPLESTAAGASLEDDRPTTKAYLPGSSAEREFRWQRGEL